MTHPTGTGTGTGRKSSTRARELWRRGSSRAAQGEDNAGALLQQASDKIRALEEENRGLKVRLDELRRAAKSTTLIKRDPTKLVAIHPRQSQPRLPKVDSGLRDDLARCKAKAAHLEEEVVSANERVAEKVAESDAALLFARNKLGSQIAALEAEIQQLRENSLMEQILRDELLAAQEEIKRLQARCTQSEEVTQNLAEVASGNAEEDREKRGAMEAFQSDLMGKLATLYEEHKQNLVRVKAREEAIKAAWDRREREFKVQWDTREKDFRELAKSSVIRRTVKVTRSGIVGEGSQGSTDLQDIFAQAQARRLTNTTTTSESTSTHDLDEDNADDAEAKAEFDGKVDKGMNDIARKHTLFSSSKLKKWSNWDNIPDS